MASLVSGRLVNANVEFAEYEVVVPGVFPGDTSRIVRVPESGPDGFSINDPDFENTGRRAAMVIWLRRRQNGDVWPDSFLFTS
ncbi:hypothetical protein [Nocardia camponoti]|uniref:hypothetical protein n=1 Tax=Nocardia camponoti TaxID=1616106 RepID=UPI00166A4B94|nr:hypothetical protein [Nocardia camponoti]